MARILISILLALAVLGAILFGCSSEPGVEEYQQAMREYDEGNFVRAKALFENSINKRPGSKENAWAYNYLGLCCWKLGQLEAAIDAFEDSRRLNPDLLEPTYNLGVFMYHNGDLFRAAALLEEAALVDLNDPRPLEFLGFIHSKNGDWAKARRALYEALGRSSKSSRVLTSLALVELHMDGPTAAVKYLMQALESDPHYAPALYNLANIFHEQLNEPEQAVAYAKQFLDVEPEGERADAARRLVRNLAPAEVKKVAAKPEPVEPPKKREEERRESERVQSVVESVGKPVPAEPPKEKEEKKTSAEDLLAKADEATGNGRAQLALNLYLQAASAAQKEGRSDLRKKALKRAVEEHFDQPRAHFAYGVFLVEQDQPADALVAFKQATVLKSDWAEAQLAVAETASVIGEYDSALVALRKAVSLQPQNADALWSLAKLYEEKLDFGTEADRAYTEFARRFPEDKRSLEVRGRMQKKEAEAAADDGEDRRKPPIEVVTPSATQAELKELARQMRAEQNLPARQLKLKKPRVRNTRAAIQAYNRGTIYQSREDWDRAIYYYRRALENDDSFARAFFNLGAVYRMNGDLDLAKDAYLHAIDLDFDLVNSRYNLALLYYELKQFTAAEEQAKQVLRLEPDHAYAHYLLGLIYARSNRTTAFAKEHYEAFVKLAPNDPAAESIRGWLKQH